MIEYFNRIEKPGIDATAAGCTSIETNEEFDVDEMDAIAGGLLGCPVHIDEENDSIEFVESLNLHRGVCNMILDFAEKNTALLNDFKHGFRVISLTPDDLVELTESVIAFRGDDEERFDAVLEAMEEELKEDTWGFFFSRMSTKETEYGYDCQLDVYHVDAWSCYKLADLTFDALYNLIAQGPGTSFRT